MSTLNLKPTHKPVKSYYAALDQSHDSVLRTRPPRARSPHSSPSAHCLGNRADDPQYILRLIGKVISVSLETVKIVAGLPELGIGEEEGEEA